MTATSSSSKIYAARMTFRELRHTFITTYPWAGDIEDARKGSRQKTVAMTMHYTHDDLSRDAALRQQVDELLEQGSRRNPSGFHSSDQRYQFVIIGFWNQRKPALR